MNISNLFKTKAKPMTTNTLELYGFTVSPHVRAASIAFAERGVSVTLHEIGPDQLATESYGHINPFRKMPALIVGDATLYETASLLVYASSIGTGPALEPTDPLARAKTWQFVGIAQNYLYPVGVMQLYFHNVLAGLFGMDPDQPLAAAAVAPTGQHLDVVEAALDGGYLAGGQFSIADIYCGTMVDYIARTRDGRALVGARPKTAAWLEGLRARSSFSSTLAPMLVGSDQV